MSNITTPTFLKDHNVMMKTCNYAPFSSKCRQESLDRKYMVHINAYITYNKDNNIISNGNDNYYNI